MRRRVVTVLCAGAMAILLSSCRTFECMFMKHRTHAGQTEPANTADWIPLAPDVDGMKVYARGEPSNPPILLLHELPGAVPETVDFANQLVKAGYRVYVPLFFGTFGGRSVGTVRQMVMCAGPNFNCLSGHESRVAAKLRQLRDRIAAEHPSQPIGIIGMCLTGGMPMALIDERVAAVVLSQPGIPFPLFGFQRRSLGVEESSIANAGKLPVHILGIHFEDDCIASPERFSMLSRHIPPERLEIYPVVSTSEKEHSVLTLEAKHSQAAKEAIAHALAFLDCHLKRSQPCPSSPTSPTSSPTGTTTSSTGH